MSQSPNLAPSYSPTAVVPSQTQNDQSGNVLPYVSVTPTGTETYGVTEQSLASIKSSFTGGSYRNFRKALGDLRTGVRTNIPVICIGDSTTQGSNGLTPNNSIQNSWVRRLADLLTSSGIQAGWQNCFGDHQTTVNQSSTIQLNDPRIGAFPAGWVLSVSGFGLAGPGPGGQFFANNSTTNPLTFTPSVQTDTLEVYYLDVTGYDPFLVKTGASGTTTPTTGGTAGITGSNLVKKLVSTYTLGSNVWTVQRSGSGTSTFVVGLSAYNSAAPEISLWNMGCGSQKVSYWTASTNFWDTLRQLTDTNGAITGAPLAIINIGVNDWLQSTNTSSFNQSLSLLVSKLQSGGTDVLLVVPIPSSTALYQQGQIISQIYQVAASQGCAVVDLTTRWVSQSISSALYGDAAIHPSYTGYSDVSQAMRPFFMNV